MQWIHILEKFACLQAILHHRVGLFVMALFCPFQRTTRYSLCSARHMEAMGRRPLLCQIWSAGYLSAKAQARKQGQPMRQDSREGQRVSRFRSMSSPLIRIPCMLRMPEERSLPPMQPYGQRKPPEIFIRLLFRKAR